MNFNIKDFSGPLDLLLHMIKKQQMDVYEVDLKIIIDEYIEFIKTFENHDLDSKSEYLTMASELVHLKSKLLLGLDENENDNEYELNSEEDLRNKIIEFEKYQVAGNNLRVLENNRKDFFTKPAEDSRNYEEFKSKGTLDLNINDLVNAILEINKRMEYIRPKNTRITRKEISITDKTNFIRNFLKEKAKFNFFDLFSVFNREEVVVTLLSVLEMSKNKEILLSQKGNFSNIFIEVYHE